MKNILVLTDLDIMNICYSYRHDFGLMTKKKQDTLRIECMEWVRAINNNMDHFECDKKLKEKQ